MTKHGEGELPTDMIERRALSMVRKYMMESRDSLKKDPPNVSKLSVLEV